MSDFEACPVGTVARLAQVEAARDALRADAELYRKLKKLDWYIGPPPYCDEASGMNGYKDHNGKGLDAAIAKAGGGNG